jgi:hypothetical protein
MPDLIINAAVVLVLVALAVGAGRWLRRQRRKGRR